MTPDVVSRWTGRAVTVAVIFIVIAAWWFLSSEVIDSTFLPSPVRVISALISLLSADFLAGHLLPSFFRVTAAFLLSLAIALPFGILISQSRVISRVMEPLFGFTRYLPVAALVPLCILWFGIDDGQKIAVIVIGVVFQLTLLFASDVSTVPHDLIEAGRTLGLSRGSIIRRIVLPWSMPAIWDDMRISAGWAWSYLVLAELVAGNSGVGYFVIQSQRYLQTDQVFAGILFIGLLGVATDLSFRLTGRRLFRWQ